MGAVWLRVRSSWRHASSAAAVTLVVALASAAVLASVAAARRTGSVADRYTETVGGPISADLEQRSGRPLTNSIAALPSVARLAAYTFVFGGFESKTQKIPDSLLTFAGSRPLSSRVIAGHDLDPARPHDFVADKGFVRALHAKLGDQFSFSSISRAQTESGAGFYADRLGARFDARLVGIVDSPDRFSSNYVVVTFPESLLQEDVGIVATVSQVRLKPGATNEQLRADLDRIPGGTEIALTKGAVVPGEVRRAVDAQTKGLWAIVVVLAIGALIALGQLLARLARAVTDERPRLLPLGYSSRQVLTEAVVRAALPAIVGIAIGEVVAIAVSRLFPTGLAGQIEPHAGPVFDATAFAVTAGPLLVALVAWVALAIGRRDRPGLPRWQRGRNLAEIVPSTSGRIGTRFAMTRNDRFATPVYATFLALVALTILFAGTATFARSLQVLVDNPARYGQNYTFQVGDNGGDASPEDLRQALANDPAIDAMMILSESSARVVGTAATLDLIGVDRVKGTIGPRATSGRLPTGPDEIALGRVSAHDLHRKVGDVVELKGESGTASFHVVGIAVLPGVGGNDGVGKGAMVLPPGLARVQDSSEVNTAAIDVHEVTPAFKERIEKLFGQPGESMPDAVLNVQRIRGVPAVLALLLLGLLALVMLPLLIVSMRARRRDVAVLRALGADGSWVARTFRWQASVLTIPALFVGVPIGVAAGSALFRSFTNRIGAIPDPTVPVAALAIVVVVLVAAANVVAFGPAWRMRRGAVASMLRTE